MFCGQHRISRSFTFQKDCERFRGITSRASRLFPSLPPFSRSIWLSLTSSASISRVDARGGLLLKGERAKKIVSERSGTHTHTHAHIRADTSSARRALYVVCDNRYACLSHTAYTHTRMHTRVGCICRNKPTALRSFDESGPRSAHFLYAFVASLVWDRHCESSNTHTRSLTVQRLVRIWLILYMNVL